MLWRLIYGLGRVYSDSFWLIPFGGFVLGWIAGFFSDQLPDAPEALQYDSSAAEALLAAVGAAMVSLSGFVITVSVLIVQTATGTFSARYLRVWYRDNVLKLVLAVLMGTSAYCFVLLRAVEPDEVPNAGVSLVAPIAGVAVVMFLVFLDRGLRHLRPVSVAASVARTARSYMETISQMQQRGEIGPLDTREFDVEAPNLEVHTRRAGVVQALHRHGLTAWAKQHGCVVVFRFGMGDFVPSGSAIVSVIGRNLPPGSEEKLLSMIVLGREATPEDDVRYSIRIMVDIANRALSAAINDPTTTTQVIDYLEETLVMVGAMPDFGGAWVERDEQGEVRLVVPAPRWEDLLTLSLAEIRGYGAPSLQVIRRLRALLTRLQDTVRPEYRRAVREELQRLEATVDSLWKKMVDSDVARVSDQHGIGGISRGPIV